jgi:uncharacterized metal-binding protein YceD (DUF177 family)
VTALPQPEFSFPVDVTNVPPVGRRYAIKADAAERARVAERLGLPDIAALSAIFELFPKAGGIVSVRGTVEASLTQTCVVTLAPVLAAVKEDVEARFTTHAPAKAPSKGQGKKAEEEVEELVAFGEEEPAEEAVDGHIDLGELAVVHLALGLDPYPRAPGAAFEAASWVKKDEKSEVQSPFAVLAQFKPKSPPKGGG